MYDAIVIGAGPAGCAAAIRLAKSGARVLLVEKMRLPREKSCSGILIKKSINLVREHFGGDVPDSVKCCPFDNRGMVLFDDGGTEYRFEQEGLNIWRSAFDGWLAERCAAAGVEVRDGTAALSCEERKKSVWVYLRDEETYHETGRYVVVCEGAVGAIRREMQAAEKDYIVTYQTFCTGQIDLDPHYFYAFLQPAFSQYDAWFNAKDDFLVMGVSVRDASEAGRYHDAFVSFLTKRYGALFRETVRAERWIMPRIRPGCQVWTGTERVLLAGEVAGFLNPMGEGISSAIETGIAAARAIADGTVSGYRNAVEPVRAYMSRQWGYVADLSGTFSEMKLPPTG